MNLLQALLDARLAAAASAYALATACMVMGVEWLQRHAESVALSAWTLRYIGRPLAHAALQLAFVLLAYPALLGLRSAPDLSIVLDHGDRLSILLNFAVLLSIALPWVTRPAGLQGLILPLQTIALLILIASWQSPQRLHYFPGILAAASGIVLVWLGHRLNQRLAGWLGVIIDRRWSVLGSGHIIREALLPLLQLPGIVLYGLFLGRQLAV